MEGGNIGSQDYKGAAMIAIATYSETPSARGLQRTARVDIEGHDCIAHGLPKGLRGTVYVLGDMRAVALLADSDDIAFGSPQATSSITLRRRPNVRMVSLDTIGYDGADPNEAAFYVARMKATLETLGIPPKDTATAVASYLLAPLRGPVAPCPVPDYAVHCGPIFHASGGGYGRHYDRRAAFLAALDDELPYYASLWVPCERIEDADVVTGTMYVRSNHGRVGPLNMTFDGGAVEYPVGYVRGTWLGHTVRMALATGLVRPHRIESMFYAANKTRALSESVQTARELTASFKQFGKAVYTRLWGLTCPGARWRGTRAAPKPWEQAVIAHGFVWRRDPPDKVTVRNAATAATIASHNYAATMGAVQACERDVIAAHVDAIWSPSADLPVNDGLGAWKLEGEGHIRYYAPGTYTTHWKDGRMVDVDRHIEGRAPAPVASLRSSSDVRQWFGDPVSDENADSIVSFIKD